MIYVNESSIHYIFTTILYGYKGLLQLIALLLAFRTRNIKVKGLDNAKYIISTVYITTIGIIIIAMASYLLREYLNVYTAVVTLSLFASTSVVLGLVFIPKVSTMSIRCMIFVVQIHSNNDSLFSSTTGMPILLALLNCARATHCAKTSPFNDKYIYRDM